MAEVLQKDHWLVWISRMLILIVLAWNLEAAISFLVSPAPYLAAFELTGLPGEIAVAGIGVLFLMWQVPYVFALLHPVRFRISLWQALIMQAIGVTGETILLFTIPGEYQLLRGSIIRFTIFDGAGILFLLGAVWLIRVSN